MNDESEICDKCGKPMLPGQARYCGGESKGIYRHADCHDWRSHKDKMKELQLEFTRLKVMTAAQLRKLR